MTMEQRIAGIEAREQAATDGPWRQGPANVWQEDMLYVVATTDIAAARTDVPWLTAKLRVTMELVRALANVPLYMLDGPRSLRRGCGCLLCDVFVEARDVAPADVPVQHKPDCPVVRARRWLEEAGE